MVSHERALELFAEPRGLLTRLLRKQRSNPVRIELLYLPYHRFRLELSGSSENQSVVVAVDGLVGDAVFFVGDDLEFDVKGEETCCEFSTPTDEARDTALSSYRRMLLEHGLRNKTKPTVAGIEELCRVYFPFWVGYFRKGTAYDFEVLDAVSGDSQGVRMRRVLLAAFRRMERR